ncbi:hypothetical protein FYC62_15010 [Pedobacter aquae]|uniref:Fibronectin type-III domain-containing protein n=1 Tax=Pedobacter aquae TaxID=2605747 RepID=A0A5C0VKZ1_9SPHI|nr:hypothetical protein [Pedobacter aquae]QEK52827.1 hypothetical protein FYC62_15010 [Pedobacter aquae]
MKKLLLFGLLIACSFNLKAQTLYDFNTTGDLEKYFQKSGTTTGVTQTTGTGLNASGSINVTQGINEIFTTKQGYSNGGIGAIYTFSTYFKSEGVNGYGGVGFTNAPGRTRGIYANLDIGLGISVHGGGFVWHNNTTSIDGIWTAGGVVNSTIADLLGAGSPDKWFKVILMITAKANSVFDLRVEVYPAYATGALISNSPAAVQTTTFTNTNLANTSILHSYFGFAGNRITNFDDYSMSLQGSSVIDAGTPVVLGTAALSGSTINLSGNVTDERNSTVSQKGFVWSKTVADPTTADTKIIASTGGLGTYSAQITDVTAGTYYVKAYAINAIGTSYGALQTITISVLPVSLISFTAKAQNNSVILDWSTSSEQYNSHFKLSYATDGANFTLLKHVSASINGNIKNAYSFAHLSPANGANYYLLEQVDLDGTVKDLGIKAVNFSLSKTTQVVFYPNPPKMR